MSPQIAHRAALQVVLHGMNERAVNTFTALFASAAWKDCALAGTTPPDLGIVDLDTPTPEKTWADYRRRHPDLPTVVLSIREQSRDNARLLRKPVSATTLRTTINQMRVEKSSTIWPSRTAISAAFVAPTNTPKSTSLKPLPNKITNGSERSAGVIPPGTYHLPLNSIRSYLLSGSSTKSVCPCRNE